MGAIVYPSTIKTDYDRLCAAYSLVEQMRLESNRAVKTLPKNLIRSYIRGEVKPRLKKLLAERNALMEKIRWANYTEKEWAKLTDEQLDEAYVTLFGDKEAEKVKPTEATSPLLDELKSLDLDKLEPTSLADPTEDFTSSDWNNGAPQSDPNSRLTITSSKIEFNQITTGEDVYFYRDMGVDHFDGDFEHLFEVLVSAGYYGSCYPILMANAIDDFRGLDLAAESALGTYVYKSGSTHSIFIRELNSGTYYSDGKTGLTLSTLFYVEFERDENVGTYGTIYAYICTGDYWDNGGTQIDTLSIALHSSKKDFRYIYAIDSTNTGSSQYWVTGYAQNLDLQEAAATEKTSSDNGAGQDAITTGNPTVFAVGAEAGSGTDIVSADSPQAMVSGAEIGSGIDVKADYPSGEITGSEPGEGSDLAMLLAVIAPPGDSGLGAETSYLETIEYIEKFGSDTGMGSEVGAAIMALVSGYEAGGGVESVMDRGLMLAESGAGAEFSHPGVVWIVIDAGAGVEASALITVLADDGGTGSDLSTLDKAVYVGDGGSGLDALKALMGTMGPSSDMRLHGRSGKVRMPSKGVNI